MRIVKLRIALGVAAVLALTLTTLASAHPSLYNIVGKVAKPPETQTITISATGTTFTPSAAATSVAWDAPAWAVQAALGADPAIVGMQLRAGQCSRHQGRLSTPCASRAPSPPRTCRQVVPDATATGGTAVVATPSDGGGPDIRYQDDNRRVPAGRRPAHGDPERRVRRRLRRVQRRR